MAFKRVHMVLGECIPHVILNIGITHSASWGYYATQDLFYKYPSRCHHLYLTLRIQYRLLCFAFHHSAPKATSRLNEH